MISYIKDIVGLVDFYKLFFITVLSCATSSCTNLFLFIKLFKIKAEKYNIIRYIISDIIIQITLTLFIPIPYYRILIIITTIALLRMCFNERFEICVLSEIISVVLYIIQEIIAFKIIYFAYNEISYTELLINFECRLLQFTIIALLQVLTCYFIHRKNLSININTIINKKNKTNIILISIVSIIVLFLNLIQISISTTQFPFILAILEILFIIYFISLSANSIIQAIKIENQNLAINDLELYNKTLSNMCDDVRGFKHDFCNFVQALDGYAQIEDINGIKKMCNSVTKDCRELGTLQILNPKTINNPAIYNIITNKYFIAQEENITMNIEIAEKFEDVNIGTYELCRILSILLDNAIEAARESKEKLINIRFYNDKRRKCKVIVVENSYEDKNINLTKIYEKGYSTKTKSSPDHGLGLWNIKKILNKNKNLKLYTTNKELFKQQLEIF